MSVKVVFPAYPSCSKTTQDVAGIPAANKWFDKAGTPADTLKKLPKAYPKSVYATEHVWEKHFVTIFLNWLTFDPPDRDVPPPKNKKSKETSKSKVSKETTGAPTEAETFKSVFKTKGTKLPFSKQMPATVIANAISTTKRIDEFMLLEVKIDTAKPVTEMKWMDFHRKDPSGLFTVGINDGAISLGSQYEPWRNREWSSMFEGEEDVDMEDAEDDMDVDDD